MTEPTIHDIARGTTGCGNDEDHGPNECTPVDISEFEDEDEWAAENALLERIFADFPKPDPWEYAGDADGSDLFTAEHVHDALCLGTGAYASELRCGQ